MNRWKYFVKVIVINILVLVTLLFVLNRASSLLLRTLKKGRNNITRAELPNYKNKIKAKQILKEQATLKSYFSAFLGWINHPFDGKYITIDNNGHRIHSHFVDSNLPKTIAVFGGSTVWGSGVANNETIPGFLDSINLNFKVYNFGTSAHNLRQNLAKLIELNSKGKTFDYVIFYNGVNQKSSCGKVNSPYGHARENYIRNLIIEDRNPKRKRLDLINGLDYLFINNIRRLIKFLNPPDPTFFTDFFDCHNNPEKVKQIGKGLIENWKVAKEITESKGGEFIAILQPNAYVEKPNLTHLPEIFLKSDQKSQYITLYREFQKLIKEENRSWIYDLTKSFNVSEYLYIDNVHVSARGNLIIAKEINKILNNDF